MPTCLKCTNNFKNRIRVDGKVRNLQKRKYCLKCSPFGLHNTSKVHLLPSGMKYVCSTCKRKYTYVRNKGSTKTRCNSCVQNDRKKNIKEFLIELLGGKCASCGYDKCVDALTFHHKNPKTKKFNIGSSYNLSPETLKKEALKCELLCMNCHIAHHHDDRRFKYRYQANI